MLLAGKTAVISGAAGPRGIGFATARLFAEHGAKVAILDLDGAAAEAAARGLGPEHRGGRLVVVAENHSVIGGLGEAAAAALLRSGVTPKFRQIGLPDAFLDAGALPTLHERYGISAEAMATSVKAWL